jgi:glutamine amidotransferase
MSKVTMVDYGLGNVFSATKVLEHCGANVELTSDPEAILRADKLVLPGVGAFRQGMEALQSRGLIEVIREFASSSRPVLGICLGMQMLFDLGREFGECEGLGVISGSVDRIKGVDSDGSSLRIPHVGWNALIPNIRRLKKEQTNSDHWEGTLFNGLPKESAYVYFVHSYVACPTLDEDVLAYFNYGNQTLVAAVRRGSVWGCQFHPERSGEMGLRIIRNFVRLD